jgi:heat shock protein HslJ
MRSRTTTFPLTAALLVLLGACSPPASAPEHGSSADPATKVQHGTVSPETALPTPAQPTLLTFDGTAQNIPVTARYPEALEVSAMGSGEGVGVHFSFRPGNDDLADAELHVFLPRGAASADGQLPFVTGPSGLMENNGWIEVRRTPAGTGRFTQHWAATVIDFSTENGRSGHIVLGQSAGQAVQVTLLYPDALADSYWNVMAPVLDSLTFATAHPAAATELTAEDGDSRLAGSAWRLVEIASMDDSVYRPAADARYELAFQPGGQLVVQADCNGGRGSWRETPPSGLELGQIATTRMACPPESIDARFLTDLGYVRSFVMENGHLFLATMADGSILEFAPLVQSAPDE